MLQGPPSSFLIRTQRANHNRRAHAAPGISQSACLQGRWRHYILLPSCCKICLLNFSKKAHEASLGLLAEQSDTLVYAPLRFGHLDVT